MKYGLWNSDFAGEGWEGVEATAFDKIEMKLKE